MDHNKITSGELEKLSGVKAVTIRYACSFERMLSVKKYRVISDATGIPLDVLCDPDKHSGFNVAGCSSMGEVCQENVPV